MSYEAAFLKADTPEQFETLLTGVPTRAIVTVEGAFMYAWAAVDGQEVTIEPGHPGTQVILIPPTIEFRVTVVTQAATKCKAFLRINDTTRSFEFIAPAGKKNFPRYYLFSEFNL